MEQLALQIIPRLAYSGQGLLLHEGIAPVIKSVEAALSLPLFSLFYLTGAPRSGKTHLSLYLSDIISRMGRFPRVIEGEAIIKRIDEIVPLDPGEVLLIDDLDNFLAAQAHEASGPFVHLVELYRKSRCPIIAFGTRQITELPCDEHVMSRLRAGEILTLGAPPERALPELIQRMAKQRGIKLKASTVAFLIKRLHRSISEIENYLERVHYLSTLFGKSIKKELLTDAL